MSKLSYQKKISDFNEMLKKSEMISMRDDFIVIERRHIHRISYNERECKIKIKYASPVNVNEQLAVLLRLKRDSNLIGELFEKNLLLFKQEIPGSKSKCLIINVMKVFVGLLLSVFFVL